MNSTATNRLEMAPPTRNGGDTTVPVLSPELLRKMNAYWRAANYLSVGQIYLYANPLLREPLTLEHVKPIVVGHWGTTPGQNFIYVHLNRVIKKLDLPTSAGPRERAAHAEILHRAYSIWESNGRTKDRALADWLQAEAEVRNER